MNQPAVFMLQVERGDYSGHRVMLNGVLVGYRPYDGSDEEQIVEEVSYALAEMLNERLRFDDFPSGGRYDEF